MQRPWHGRKVVVTAGPTREYLDDIRFLSNGSTGRMGYELARAARRRHADVTLILGPAELPPIAGVRLLRVTSTQEMLTAARSAARDADLVIFAAAPSDWRPRRPRRGKPARAAGGFLLDLVPTPDIAESLGKRKGHRVHVGFALEVGAGEARARRKMERKNLDAIVLNGPENMGAGGGKAAWLARGAPARALEVAPKAHLARAILDRITPLLPKALPR